MKRERLIKISKYLSYHLRHHPEKIGIQLKAGGWVSVDELLTASQENNFPIDLNELKEVVSQNDKKRFSLNETQTLIRAHQGHSIEIDLQLIAQHPPRELYHGTAAKNIPLILQTGLSKMSRHHVHLSVDITNAKKVAERKGKPIVLRIDSALMDTEGYLFYCTDNGVWLVEEVPPQYLQIMEI